jgi:autotransporter-associated beta strand protein
MVLSSDGTIDTSNNSGTLNGVISGAGGLTKAGSGTATLDGTNTYTGGSTINAGTVVINSVNSLGASSGALALNGATLEVATGFTSSRNITLGSSASTIQVDAGQTYIAGGVLSGTGSLNKTGTGGLTLNGTNNFTGVTEIYVGTLTASGSGAGALGSTTNVTVGNSGTLLLGASNQINNSATMTMDGGTFAKGNFSEGSTVANGVGALTLTDNSTLDFGAGTVGVLRFTDLIPDANLLVINNWTGTANTVGSGTTDRLIFNTDQTANLAYFAFTGFAPGGTQFVLAGGAYEVTPLMIPEPGTYAGGALAFGAILYSQRKRWRRKSGESIGV